MRSLVLTQDAEAKADEQQQKRLFSWSEHTRVTPEKFFALYQAASCTSGDLSSGIGKRKLSQHNDNAHSNPVLSLQYTVK
jgi:hypothetical protein